MIKRCVVCGVEFKACRSAKTCSPSCSKQNARNRLNAWARGNPERIREYAKRDRDKHRDRVRAAARSWRKNNLERALQIEAEARLRRGPKHAAASKSWREKYPERAVASREKHKAKRSAALKLVRELQTKGLEVLL